jgi:hypothetical protein
MCVCVCADDDHDDDDMMMMMMTLSMCGCCSLTCCFQRERPDVFVLRGNYLCGCIEIKLSQDSVRDNKSYGQAFDYLIRLKETGVLLPLVLLTNYNEWVLCALPESKAELEKPAEWNKVTMEGTWPKGGLQVDAAPLSEIVSPQDAQAALGIPVYPQETGQSRRSVFVVTPLESAKSTRAIIRSPIVEVTDKEALRELVGGFLVRCLFAPVSEVEQAIVKKKWKRVTLNGELALKVAAPVSMTSFTPVCNLARLRGYDGEVLITSNAGGEVVAIKRYHNPVVSEKTLNDEMYAWNLVHGPKIDGIPDAKNCSSTERPRMLMPYVYTCWNGKPYEDQRLAQAMGCKVEESKDRLRAVVDDELRRVAGLGLKNKDARMVNMGFYMKKGQLHACMLDFCSTERFSGAKRELRAWAAKAFEDMRKHMDADQRLYVEHKPPPAAQLPTTGSNNREQSEHAL